MGFHLITTHLMKETAEEVRTKPHIQAAAPHRDVHHLMGDHSMLHSARARYILDSYQYSLLAQGMVCESDMPGLHLHNLPQCNHHASFSRCRDPKELGDLGFKIKLGQAS